MQALQDAVAFPDFQSCPDEYTIDFQHYKTSDGSNFTPSRHWCLLAEIAQVEFFVRLRLTLRDKSGHHFPLAFYGEDTENVNPADYRVGYTVAILYPQQHGFLDMTVGIRQEYMKSIQVIPLSLTTILQTQIDTVGMSKDGLDARRTQALV
ncbi:uncharacterized protein KY384_007242 [Bacidia gigantensis]|uniref:uncharacterized protein n=1 Tax=Bacidia gigantensis TaxID=2732470 RepID=UPI001D04D089|nr:uncharacterized protein KY384_007242 [Bacidia gigantensis]KAG8528324.1 hypothetical protein KY384_007242 [Bacidia gigantensis]